MVLHGGGTKTNTKILDVSVPLPFQFEGQGSLLCFTPKNLDYERRAIASILNLFFKKYTYYFRQREISEAFDARCGRKG